MGINVAKVSKEEYSQVAYTVVKTVDTLISKNPMFAESMHHNLQKRRSLGIGITGLAGHLAQTNRSYLDDIYIEELALCTSSYLLII